MATEDEVTQSKQSGADRFGSELQAGGDLPRSQGAEGWPWAGRHSHSPPAGGTLRHPSRIPFQAPRQELMSCQLSNKVLSLDLKAL